MLTGLTFDVNGNLTIGLRDRAGDQFGYFALDNPANSILDMQTVNFVNGQPVFTKYMDSFPFPFYIVLRDIAALPRTLADLMRQWFELSKGM